MCCAIIVPLNSDKKLYQNYVNERFVRDSNNIYEGEIENFSLPRGEHFDRFNFISISIL